MALGARIPIGVTTLPETAADTISFGIFEVDRQSGELRRNGVKVKLQEQPLQILLTLLETPGAVVTREELRSRLWAADTYVDFDHSLNAAVRRLRDALGDSAENPRFVETVARRGYRFLAPVRTNGQVVEVVATYSATYRWWVAGGVGLAILIFGVVLGWHAGHGAKAKVPTERRLTANSPQNLVTDGIISPDGKYLAFADAGGLFLRQIDTGETHAVPLPKELQLKPASWFPDGVHMLATWVAGPQESPSIWEFSVLGGTPRKLTDKGFAPAISPDGSQVAFLSGTSEATHGYLMNADGTNVRTLIPDDGRTFIGTPVWSPDAKRIAYARGNYAAGYSRVDVRIEVLDPATGKTNVALSIPGLGSSVAWTADGRLIYSLQESAPNQDDANLWAIHIGNDGPTRGEAWRLTRGPGYACLVSITADARRLAYFRRSMEPDIYIADIEANGTKLSEPRQLTFDERSDLPYAWTPDSQSVLFISDRNGNFNLFKQNVNEPQPEILVSGADATGIPRLSPDGKFVLYLVPPRPGDQSTDVRLMRIPLAGGPPEQVLVLNEASNQQCARLPSTVCIISTIQAGRERFFYFDSEKGLGAEIKNAEVESSNSFDFNWSLSPDGTTMALARKEGFKDESAVLLLPLRDGAKQTIRVPGNWLGIGSIDWAAYGKSMWATAYAGTGPRRLINIDTAGHVRPMLDESRLKLGWAIPSPDGKHLALWKASGASNVWMLENF